MHSESMIVSDRQTQWQRTNRRTPAGVAAAHSWAVGLKRTHMAVALKRTQIVHTTSNVGMLRQSDVVHKVVTKCSKIRVPALALVPALGGGQAVALAAVLILGITGMLCLVLGQFGTAKELRSTRVVTRPARKSILQVYFKHLCLEILLSILVTLTIIYIPVACPHPHALRLADCCTCQCLRPRNL